MAMIEAKPGSGLAQAVQGADGARVLALQLARAEAGAEGEKKIKKPAKPSRPIHGGQVRRGY